MIIHVRERVGFFRFPRFPPLFSSRRAHHRPRTEGRTFYACISPYNYVLRRVGARVRSFTWIYNLLAYSKFRKFVYRLCLWRFLRKLYTCIRLTSTRRWENDKFCSQPIFAHFTVYLLFLPFCRVLRAILRLGTTLADYPISKFG